MENTDTVGAILQSVPAATPTLLEANTAFHDAILAFKPQELLN